MSCKSWVFVKKNKKNFTHARKIILKRCSILLKSGEKIQKKQPESRLLF